MSNIYKYFIKDKNYKMKTHLVKENGSKKCNGKTHNEKNIKKKF